MTHWFTRRTYDPAVWGSTPITAYVLIVLGKQFTNISSVQPSAKWAIEHEGSILRLN